MNQNRITGHKSHSSEKRKNPESPNHQTTTHKPSAQIVHDRVSVRMCTIELEREWLNRIPIHIPTCQLEILREEEGWGTRHNWDW